jgi:hypothetical protein
MHNNTNVSSRQAVRKPSWEPYPASATPRNPVTPFLATHPQKVPPKSFSYHTSINKGLKVLYLPHIQKHGGWGGDLSTGRAEPS